MPPCLAAGPRTKMTIRIYQVDRHGYRRAAGAVAK